MRLNGMTEGRSAGLPEVKARFKTVLRRISDQDSSLAFAEAAFPAYAHPNPIIDRLFWGRLQAVESFVTKRTAKPLILDFGCGSGVMSYTIASSAQRVVATDEEPLPYKRVSAELAFPPNVEFVMPHELTAERYRSAFDLILALDVLEHLEDLSGTLALFKDLLRQGGAVVASVPTESALYKIGRFLAGSRFTGHYHTATFNHIKSECEKAGRITPIATLYPLLPLFRIFSLEFE